MSVSNVNLISSYQSYGPKNFKYETFFSNIVKFMVSGYDPLDIESITVTNKLARVVTIEKNFITLPGCKLAITGTNNSELDTRIEIEEVFKDGFSFKTEALDGVYTNGLQYYVPGLGWSLIKQTATEYIFKSGNNAITPFYLIFRTVNRILTVHIAFKIDNNNEAIDAKPVYYSDSMQLSIVVSGLPYNNHYYLYGDDAFILIATNAENRANPSNPLGYDFSVVGFGECNSSFNNVPPVALFGVPCNQPQYYDNINMGGNGAYSEILANFYTTFTSTGFNSYFPHLCYYYLNNKTTQFGCAIATPKKIKHHYSGAILNTNLLDNKNSAIEFLKQEIVSENGISIGYVPGVYYISKLTTPLNTLPLMDLGREIFIKNKKRKCLLARYSYFSGYNYTSYSNNGNNNLHGHAILDLTGPIR